MDASMPSQMHCHDGTACSLSDIRNRQSPPRRSTVGSPMQQIHDWSVRWMGACVNRQIGRLTGRLTRKGDRVGGNGRQNDGKALPALIKIFRFMQYAHRPPSPSPSRTHAHAHTHQACAAGATAVRETHKKHPSQGKGTEA